MFDSSIGAIILRLLWIALVTHSAGKSVALIAGAWRTRYWHKTTGMVEHVDIRTASIVAPGPDLPVHTPRAKYHFQVNGEQFSGDRINFFGFWGKDALAFYSKRKQNPRVTVWYNPTSPQDAVLEPWSWKATVTYLGFLSIGLGVFGFIAFAVMH